MNRLVTLLPLTEMAQICVETFLELSMVVSNYRNCLKMELSSYWDSLLLYTAKIYDVISFCRRAHFQINIALKQALARLYKQ